jgi:DNA-binding transcriptional ArsR family regulator
VDTFAVLAEPNRRAILASLQAGDRTVGELVNELPLSQPTVSKHLRVLRANRFVTSRPDAQRRIYRLRPERFRELDEWLEPYRHVWSTRLDALVDHLNQMESE